MITQGQTVTMAASPAWLNFPLVGNSEMMLHISGSVATDWVFDAADAAAAAAAKTAGTYGRSHAAATTLIVSANPTRLWALGTSTSTASAIRVGG